MSDFRITISDIEGVEPSTLAESIMDAHGDGFDAARGDFTCEVDGERVIITVLDVTGGDVDMLASDIESDEDGTFFVRMSQRQGTSWFTRDEGDDEL